MLLLMAAQQYFLSSSRSVLYIPSADRIVRTLPCCLFWLRHLRPRSGPRGQTTTARRSLRAALSSLAFPRWAAGSRSQSCSTWSRQCRGFVPGDSAECPFSKAAISNSDTFYKTSHPLLSSDEMLTPRDARLRTSNCFRVVNIDFCRYGPRQQVDRYHQPRLFFHLQQQSFYAAQR